MVKRQWPVDLSGAGPPLAPGPAETQSHRPKTTDGGPWPVLARSMLMAHVDERRSSPSARSARPSDLGRCKDVAWICAARPWTFDPVSARTDCDGGEPCASYGPEQEDEDK
jgi:hypothetical protein